MKKKCGLTLTKTHTLDSLAACINLTPKRNKPPVSILFIVAKN